MFIVLAALAAGPVHSQCDLPPPIEIDEFQSSAVIELIGPNGTENIRLTGPSTVHVAIGPNGEAADTDGDGLDQVKTEMVQLSLTGTSSMGPVSVEIRPVTKDPFKCSSGEIEETANTQTGRLDVPPFAPSGTAFSFFDVFFEITVSTPMGPAVLHNRKPKRMQSLIDHKPPDEGTVYENPDTIPLYYEDNSLSPYSLGASRHAPKCDRIPPFCPAIPTMIPNGIQVTVQDAESGLFKIEVTELVNATIQPPIAFPLGTRSPVAVNAYKNQAGPSRLGLRITDICGNVTLCDPVIWLQARDTGKPESQTVNDLSQSEGKITVFNGTPGVKTLRIEVNGSKYMATNLRDGEERTIDASSAMRPGNGNTIVVTALGKPGGSAEIMIHD
jgi:hypothetical protein